MEWDLPQVAEEPANPNDEFAETSALWLIGWAIVLPFAHPIRLFAYGLPLLLILLGLSLVFPDASILGGVFMSDDVGIEPHLGDRPYGDIAAMAVSLVSALVLAFLLCIWQRDVMRGFKDPISRLVSESAARLPAYCAGIVLLFGFLLAFMLLTGFASNPKLGFLPPGLLGFIVGVMLLIPLAWIYARLSLLPALIAAAGLKGMIRRSWNMTAGRAMHLSLCFIALAFCLMVPTAIAAGTGLVLYQSTGDPWTSFRVIGSLDFIATVTVLLWIAAVPALTARRLSSRYGIDPTVFD